MVPGLEQGFLDEVVGTIDITAKGDRKGAQVRKKGDQALAQNLPSSRLVLRIAKMGEQLHQVIWNRLVQELVIGGAQMVDEYI